MIRIDNSNFEISEVIKEEETLDHPAEHIAERPAIVEAKVYKLKSGFVKHSVYITLGYIEQGGKKRPIEIFINSKDLTKNAEYAVLTRLISAIFRKSANPTFILEELSSIHDPNGGYHRNGKFIHSFYSEVADVIERFFIEIGLVNKEPKAVVAEAVSTSMNTRVRMPDIANSEFQICPDCNDRSVKMENGCLTCVNPDCGYSKCDK
jgi:ribonucleoside-diphosphate reductase alpha chain